MKTILQFLGLALVFTSCLEPKEPATRQGGVRSGAQSSEEEAQGSQQEAQTNEQHGQEGAVVVIMTYPDADEETRATGTIRHDSEGRTVIEIARNLSGAVNDETIQEYRGEALHATDTFTTIELTIPTGIDIPLHATQVLLPRGFVLKWVHSMIANDPADPLCEMNENANGTQECGRRWIEEVIDDSRPAVVSLSINRLEPGPNGWIDIAVKVHRYPFIDVNGRHYFCCGTMSVELNTALNAAGEYPLSSEVWPRSIVCGFETLGSPKEECSAD